MTQSVSRMTEEELFSAGEVVPASGEYEIVDQEGNPTDYDFVTLDEGERFPELKESNLCYMLHDTEEDTSP